MTLKKRIFRICAVVVMLAMVFQTLSCGTILYPERRSSPSASGFDPKGRQIDLAVAFLDAIFLIFYIVPGLVAFGVDFATGAIYIPNSRSKKKSSALTGDDEKDMTVIYVPPEKLNPEMLQTVIFQQTGVMVNFESNTLKTFKMKGPEAAGFVMAGFDPAQLPAH